MKSLVKFNKNRNVFYLQCVDVCVNCYLFKCSIHVVKVILSKVQFVLLYIGSGRAKERKCLSLLICVFGTFAHK